MGERFDGDVVAGIDFKLRLQELAEISPMHGVGVSRQVMIGRLAGRGLRRRRRRQRAAAGPCGRRAAACEKRALEKAAPLAVEIVEQLLPMEFEFRTSRVIPSAHSRTSPFIWRSYVASCINCYFPPIGQKCSRISLITAR